MAWLPLVILIACLAGGCASSHPSHDLNLTRDAEGIRDTGAAIRTQADGIRSDLADTPPTEQTIRADARAEQIQQLTARLDAQAAELEKAHAAAKAKDEEHAKRTADLEKQIADLESAKGAAEARVWLMFRIGGGLAIIGGIVLFAFYPKLAPLVLLAGGAAIGVGHFMDQWVAWAGLAIAALLLFVLGLVAWAIWKQRGTIVELVKTGELFRRALPAFHQTHLEHAISKKQTPETKRVVSEIRERSGLADLTAAIEQMKAERAEVPA